jgi:predicted DCC family thiol-disulfide oxidoreductase YuxK
MGRVSERNVPWLVFDGDCAFCTSAATWVAERLHRLAGPNARLAPWQFSDLAALGTTPERAQREVLWVTPEGAISGGAAAFADWLRFRGGPYGVVGRAMGLPVVRRLAAAVYRLIAQNRDRMPGGSPACALPPTGFDPAQPGSKAL